MIGLLASYWTWRNVGLDSIADWDGPIFVDSGAFSAHTIGADIDLDTYAKWVKDQPTPDIVCTLDVIGDPAASAANTDRLRALGIDALPVFHVDSPWDELEALCAPRSLVAVGGMVPHMSKKARLLRWSLKACQIARQSDCHLHGFGLTSIWTLSQTPFYSMDSSSWFKFNRFGELRLWDDMRGLLYFGGYNRRNWGKEAPLIRSYGLDPARVAHPDYARPASPTVDADRAEIMIAQTRAWIRVERWRQRRFGAMHVDGMPDGPHLFLVVSPPIRGAKSHVEVIHEALAIEDES